MANAEELSMILPSEMVAEIRAAVNDGDYGSVSEVVRDALRHWHLRRKAEALPADELRTLVREGMQSGPAIDADEVFGRLLTWLGAARTT
jgi:antitoxin ParD1/3/4